MASEVFKDIPGYEGLYQVSNTGLIRSLPREILRAKGKYNISGKIKKQTIIPGGYKVVRLSKVTARNYLVHRLVAIVFIKNPMNYNDVDHIDQNPSNNIVENLRWASRSLNNFNSNKRQSSKTSKYIGVCLCKQTNKWTSNVYYNKKLCRIGRFSEENEAAMAHDIFCIKNNLNYELNFKRGN